MSLGALLKNNLSKSTLIEETADDYDNQQVKIFVEEIIETMTESIVAGNLPERVMVNNYAPLRDFQPAWAEFKYRDEFDLLRNWCNENDLSFRFTGDMQDNYFLAISPN